MTLKMRWMVPCALGLVGLVAAMGGCGSGIGDGGQVTTELKRVAGGTTSGASLWSGSAALGPDVSYATDFTSEDVQIESLKMPISSISLGTGDALMGGEGKSKTIFQCDEGENPGCFVDLVGTALTNLLTSGRNTFPIEAGTYTSVMVGTCSEANIAASGYTVSLKAKVTLGTAPGTTYYTKAGSEYMTTVEADYSPVTVSFQGCQNYSILNNPLAIGSEGATVNLFVDLRNLAYTIRAGSGLASQGANGNCTMKGTSTGTDPFICLDYPNVAGSLNGAAPTIERYRVAVGGSTTAANIVGIFFDPVSGLPLAGYTRKLINDTYTTTAHLPGQFKRAIMQDGKLFLTDYGMSPRNTDTIAGNGDFTVDDFPRPAMGQTSAATSFKDSEGVVSGQQFTATRIE